MLPVYSVRDVPGSYRGYHTPDWDPEAETIWRHQSSEPMYSILFYNFSSLDSVLSLPIYNATPNDFRAANHSGNDYYLPFV